MQELYEAWCMLPARLQTNTFQPIYDAIMVANPGVLVNNPTKVPKNKVTGYIAGIFNILGNWELGKSYLRFVYVQPLRKGKAVTIQPPAGFLNDEKQAKATTILRLWATAPSSSFRGQMIKRGQALITGQPSIEDTISEMRKAHPTTRTPNFVSDAANRDFITYEKYYRDHTTVVEMLVTQWQNFQAGTALVQLPEKQNVGVIGQVDLIFADPWYQAQYQPTALEAPKLRKLLDQVSHDNTVMIIFGRGEILHKYWAPVFEKGFASSKVDWKVESSYFNVVRTSLRDRHTHNNNTWHSMIEHALTVVRQPVHTPKPASRKKKSTSNVDEKLCVWRYSDHFKLKYGVNGTPSNVYKDYEPPSARCRLRDDEGKELRKNAEKSVLLNEFLLDLLVPDQGLVWDMFAGTGSMALACIKTNRFYVGTEPDDKVVTWATQRIGRAWHAVERGYLTSHKAGCSRELTEQVCRCVHVCVCTSM